MDSPHLVPPTLLTNVDAGSDTSTVGAARGTAIEPPNGHRDLKDGGGCGMWAQLMRIAAVICIVISTTTAALLTSSDTALAANNCYTYTKDCTSPTDTRWNCASNAVSLLTIYDNTSVGKATVDLRASTTCYTAWSRMNDYLCWTWNYACVIEKPYIFRKLSDLTIYSTYSLATYNSQPRWSKQMQNPFASKAKAHLNQAAGSLYIETDWAVLS